MTENIWEKEKTATSIYNYMKTGAFNKFSQRHLKKTSPQKSFPTYRP